MGVDLLRAGLLPPLPAAYVQSRNLNLLRPVSFGAPAVEDLPRPQVDRRALAAGLADANREYGHPAAAELAHKLADPDTAVVVTGQQPGLFGGPLYTLSKAVAAQAWAERIEASGRQAVAVFWVATEDHDFREIAETTFLAADGPRRWSLGEDREPLVPVGGRKLGPGVAEILEELREAVPGERFAAWLDRLQRWYHPEATFGEAFCGLLAGLLAERCPLLLDAMLPAVKQVQSPWYSRVVERRWELDRAYTARNQEIESRDLPLQVRPAPGTSPLFALEGGQRRRIEWRGDEEYGLRGLEGSTAPVRELLGEIASQPQRFSAGVMVRVALQDAILGTSLLVLGPGEASYLAQVTPAYEVLGIAAPAMVLRPQALLVAGHQAEKMAALGLTLETLLAADFDPDRFLADGGAGELVEPSAETIRVELERLRDRALAIDSNLAAPWDKTRKQIDKALQAFSGRVTGALARRDEQNRKRVLDLLSTFKPVGRLQERAVSTAHFPGKFGERLVEAYFEQLDLAPVELQVIEP